ncbi:unnamed protein product, partial [Linum tenue]
MRSLLFKSILSLHPKHCPSSISHFAMATATRARIRGVVFDMDGTLTVPTIDFPAMHNAVLGEDEYRRIKAENPTGIDILHHIQSWSPDRQRKAYEIIVDYERQGSDRLQIMPGAAELCGFLDSKKIRMGLITRNFKEAVDIFHSRFGRSFSPALSREFRPCKPDPAPLLHICSEWGVQPDEVIMIGDSLQDDVVCGKRAGAFTCLLDEEGMYSAADIAEFVCRYYLGGVLALIPVACKALPVLMACILLSNIGASITEVAKDALVAEYGQKHRIGGLQSYASMAFGY